MSQEEISVKAKIAFSLSIIAAEIHGAYLLIGSLGQAPLDYDEYSYYCFSINAVTSVVIPLFKFGETYSVARKHLLFNDDDEVTQKANDLNSFIKKISIEKIRNKFSAHGNALEISKETIDSINEIAERLFEFDKKIGSGELDDFSRVVLETTNDPYLQKNVNMRHDYLSKVRFFLKRCNVNEIGSYSKIIRDFSEKIENMEMKTK